MNPTDSFDRHVSDWLHADAEHRVPAHLDAVLRRTGSERQRPAWSSLERWLPMESTARFAPVPRLAWALAIVALLLVVVATAVFVGSRRPAPSPFGETSRGTVLYGATDGDIYALDTATNLAVPLIVGPMVDRDPVASPDGRRFMFTQHSPAGTSLALVVANADGSEPRTLIQGLTDPSAVAWSPSSDALAVIGTVDGVEGLWIVGLDGQNTLVRREQPGTGDGLLAEPHWLPGGEGLVFIAGTIDTGAPTTGLYRIGADGSNPRVVVAPTVRGLTYTSLSPDGTQVAYAMRTVSGFELHIADIETATDRVVAFDVASDDRRPQWSPDGTRLLFERYAGESFQLAIASAAGGPVTLIGPERPGNSGGSHARFSPDGTRVLAYYESDGSSWVLDPVAGTAIQLPDDIDSPLSWQGTTP
jgi:Tol biopolymer transport system component